MAVTGAETSSWPRPASTPATADVTDLDTDISRCGVSGVIALKYCSAAIRNTVTSSKVFPTIDRPVGTPSRDSPDGTLSTGHRLAMLNGTVIITSSQSVLAWPFTVTGWPGSYSADSAGTAKVGQMSAS